ncbi:MAG: hypothetical protein ACOCUS_05720 [Polyangiales bacterium]
MSTHHEPLALATAVLLAGLGCADSHGMDGEDSGPIPRDGGVVRTDGGSRDAGGGSRDAGGGSDAGGGTDAGAGIDAGSNTCSLEGGGVSVSVEAITSNESHCTRDAMDGRPARFYGVEPTRTGALLSLDFCPTADDDCRCAVRIGGVGRDLADDLVTPASGEQVVFRIDGERAVMLEEAIACEPCPPGEPCPPCAGSVVLYAVDGSIFSPPFSPTKLDMEAGPEVCTGEMEDGCYDLRRKLRAVENVGDTPVEPATVEVDEGETATLGDTGVRVRGIRTTGQGCIDAFVEPMAAWVAWEP